MPLAKFAAVGCWMVAVMTVAIPTAGLKRKVSNSHGESPNLDRQPSFSFVSQADETGGKSCNVTTQPATCACCTPGSTRLGISFIGHSNDVECSRLLLPLFCSMDCMPKGLTAMPKYVGAIDADSVTLFLCETACDDIATTCPPSVMIQPPSTIQAPSPSPETTPNASTSSPSPSPTGAPAAPAAPATPANSVVQRPLPVPSSNPVPMTLETSQSPVVALNDVSAVAAPSPPALNGPPSAISVSQMPLSPIPKEVRALVPDTSLNARTPPLIGDRLDSRLQQASPVRPVSVQQAQHSSPALNQPGMAMLEHRKVKRIEVTQSGVHSDRFLHQRERGIEVSHVQLGNSDVPACETMMLPPIMGVDNRLKMIKLKSSQDPSTCLNLGDLKLGADLIAKLTPQTSPSMAQTRVGPPAAPPAQPAAIPPPQLSQTLLGSPPGILPPLPLAPSAPNASQVPIPVQGQIQAAAGSNSPPIASQSPQPLAPAAPSQGAKPASTSQSSQTAVISPHAQTQLQPPHPPQQQTQQPLGGPHPTQLPASQQEPLAAKGALPVPPAQNTAQVIRAPPVLQQAGDAPIAQQAAAVPVAHQLFSQAGAAKGQARVQGAGGEGGSEGDWMSELDGLAEGAAEMAVSKVMCGFCFNSCCCYAVWGGAILMLTFYSVLDLIIFLLSARLFSRGLWSSSFYKGGGYWLLGAAGIGLATGLVVGGLVTFCIGGALFFGGGLMTFAMALILVGLRGSFLGFVGGMGVGAEIGLMTGLLGATPALVGLCIGGVFGGILGFLPILSSLKMNERYVRSRFPTRRRTRGKGSSGLSSNRSSEESGTATPAAGVLLNKEDDAMTAALLDDDDQVIITHDHPSDSDPQVPPPKRRS